MEKLVTKTQKFSNCALFEVEVGTTGLCGGDSGCGGRTFLRFGNRGGTDMRVESDHDNVSLTIGGDGELENLISGLQFALDVLKESRENGTAEDNPRVSSVMVE
jgi:hypothetical protein